MNFVTQLKEKLSHHTEHHVGDESRFFESIRSMSVRGVWALMLTISALVALGCVAWSFFLFSNIENAELFPETHLGNGGGSSVSREALLGVLETVNEREDLFEALKTRRPVPGVVFEGVSAEVPEKLFPVDPTLAPLEIE